jgi:hypothetical protein
MEEERSGRRGGAGRAAEGLIVTISTHRVSEGFSRDKAYDRAERRGGVFSKESIFQRPFTC